MDEQPTHIDLFSGIGGFALAARWAGFRTVAFCEIDPYCRRVLTKNFGHVADTDSIGTSAQRGYAREVRGLQKAQCGTKQRSDLSSGSGPSIHADIFNFDGTTYRGVTLITGGFPCQPFSVAGKRRGNEDDRHLWPEMLRVIAEARPAWVLGENVPGIIAMELDNVLSQLEAIGYSCRPFVIPACAVDARHRRNRLWIVANASERRRDRDVAHTHDSADNESWSQRDQWSLENSYGESGERASHWSPEPDVGRVAHGIPNRAHRLRGLGNAIVPQVAFEILREIRKLI